MDSVLAEVSTELQKMHSFEYFVGNNSENKHRSVTNEPISYIFSALFVTFIFAFENSLNSFSCDLPFDL